ncbi:hypothetical protein JCM10213_001971 [Rhodosporidiobolus nylandii]
MPDVSPSYKLLQHSRLSADAQAAFSSFDSPSSRKASSGGPPYTSDHAFSDDEDDSEGEGNPQHLQVEKAVPFRLGNFDLVTEHELDVPPFTRIAKWQSRESGLKVIWANTPGPVASFWATLNTEIFNSSGEPHTLEHLTFTSSEHHPYSDILDTLSNRMLSQGVNAWTAQDNTTYTIQSCSEEGLLQVIPVYLDHILFPQFTPEIFATEIYHVDGKGEEGGVVFSEMQGREGSQGDAMDRALAEVLYNSRNGYLSETGGQLDALRTLTLDDIEDYHSRAYVPQNLTIVVTGQSIHPEKLLATLDATVERDLKKAGLAKGPKPKGWVRPFVESSTARNPPVLQRDVVKTVEYAESDESVGQINISWVGPRVHDWLTNAALTVLGIYLGGGSTAPLSKLFVEIPDPACSAVAFDSEFRDPCILTISLVSVPTHRLPSLGGELLDALREILRTPFDEKRMRSVLKQQKVGLLQTLEQNPDAYVQGSVSQDILYGAENGKDFERVFEDLKLVRKMEKFVADDWLDLLETWFVERHSVTLIGTPSASLAKQQSAAITSRVAATRKRLGSVGLAKAGAALAAATTANDHPPPAKLVESWKVPDIKSVQWLKVETARSNGVGKGRETFKGKLQEKINQEGVDLPFFCQFDHYPSSFVSVSCFLHGPPTAIFPLFLDTFFAMPVRRANGKLLSFEQASRLLDEEMTGFSAQTMGEGILVTIQGRKEEYHRAIAWLSDTLYGTQWDVDRLKNLVNTSLQNLPDEKEDGAGVASAAVDSLIFSAGSFCSPINLLNRAKLYPQLRQRLQKDPQGVVDELDWLRSSMLDPRAMRMKVSGDVLSLHKPVQAWLEHFEHVLPFPAAQLAPVLHTRNLLTDLGKKPAKKALLYTLSSSESTYLVARTTCPPFTHADYPALCLAATSLSATNSFLWKAVRGPGLAYGAFMGLDAEGGSLSFTAFKSPDAFKAFAAAQKVVLDIVTGKKEVTQADMDSARSQVVFGKVSSVATLADAADACFVNTVLFDQPADAAQRLLKKLERVTPSDVQLAIKKWILPVFDPESSIFGATTSEEKRAELLEAFGKLGYTVEEGKL